MTHIHSAYDNKITLNQFKRFESITSDINLSEVPIIHLCASDATLNYDKISYANGCRLGIVMYGLAENKDLNLKSTFSLYSTIIQINEDITEIIR